MLHDGPLAVFLAQHRAVLNARFAQARHTLPQLDGQVFLQHLRETLAPIADAVAAEASEQFEPALFALYDLSLDLVGKQLLGPMARRQVVNEGWQSLLPRVPQLLGAEPVRVAGAVTNALYNLSRHPSARPAEWLGRMIRLAPACESAVPFLACGQVAAWLAGLARYRESALDVAAGLPPRLAAFVLGLEHELPAEPLANLLDMLREDPWRTPEAALADLIKPGERPRSLDIVAQAGAFRGLGGEFLAPPRVSAHDGRLYVTDGTGDWLLAADVFGTDFIRCAKPRKRATASQSLNHAGVVEWQGQTCAFEELADASSCALLARTLAVTLPTSHRVYLVANR